MLYWECPPLGASTPASVRDFAALWQRAEKIVYSRTLEGVSSARTRIERRFDPQGTRRLKRTVNRDVTVGGADLAGQALAHGLVDELHLLAVPVVMGGGKRWLPNGLRVALELLESRTLTSGVVFLK